MLCLEHLRLLGHSSATSPSLRGASASGLDSSHPEVSFLPAQCPGLSTLLGASLVFTFLLPLFPCRPPPPALAHSEETGVTAGRPGLPGWRGGEGF